MDSRSGRAVVEAEKAAEALARDDFAIARTARALDQLVPKTLVILFAVEVPVH